MEWPTGDRHGDERSGFALSAASFADQAMGRPACRAAIVYGRVSVRADRSVRQASARSATRLELRTIATRAELALTLHRLTWIPGGTP